MVMAGMLAAALGIVCLLLGAESSSLTVKLTPVRHSGQTWHQRKLLNLSFSEKELGAFSVSHLDVDLAAWRPLQISAQGVEPVQLLADASAVTVDLQNVHSLLYTAELHTGLSGRPARIVVDTGSGDFWLKPEVAVEHYHGKTHVSVLPLTDNATGHALMQEYQIHYGLGTVIALPVVEEHICIEALCVKYLELMLAVKIMGVEQLSVFDGLVGLGLNGLQQAPTNFSFLQAVQTAGGFRHFGFALTLRGEDGESQLSFGEVDDLLKATEKGMELPGGAVPLKIISQPGYWMVDTNLDVYQRDLNRTLVRASGLGILDSGSSFLAMPEDVLGYIVLALTYGKGGLASLAVDSNRRLLIACNADLNDLVFRLEGEDGRTLQVNLTKEDLVQQDPVGPLALFSTWCPLRILAVPRSANIPFLIIGDPFLRKVSAVFDTQGARVHIVPTSQKVVGVEAQAAFQTQSGDAWFLTVTLLLLTVAAAIACILGRRSTESGHYLAMASDAGAVEGGMSWGFLGHCGAPN